MLAMHIVKRSVKVGCVERSKADCEVLGELVTKSTGVVVSAILMMSVAVAASVA